MAVATIVGGLLALGLQPSTGVDTLVSSSSADYQATQRAAEQFGSSPVMVLVRQPLSELLSSGQLTRISELEACLAGQQLTTNAASKSLQPVAVDRARPYGGDSSPCGTLMRERPAQVVYGPGTFLNQAVAAVNRQLTAVEDSAASSVASAKAEARKLAAARGENAAMQAQAAKIAGELALEQQLKSVGGLASELQSSGTPSIDNRAFLNSIVFGSAAGSGTPNSRFSYLFPSADAALIQVRLRAGLSDQQQAAAIKLIRAAVSMPQFRLDRGSYTVTGEPVVLADLASGIAGQLLLLLLGAVVMMALVLLAIFRRRPRLLPLVVALCAAAVTFGLAALVGASLTMASVAVLPVLIGLGVDYSVQLQSGTSRASVAVAGVATAAGFLALLLSPVPMVRGFGLLLVAGVLLSLLITRAVVPAIAEIRRRRASAQTTDARAATSSAARSTPAALRSLVTAGRDAAAILADAAAILRDAWWGAVDILRGAARRLPSLAAVLAALVRRPLALLAIGLILAAGGWVLDAKTPVQSDITKLVPTGTPALRHLDELEQVTGTSGEIDVLVHARKVATPRVLDWMVSYEQRMASHFGYTKSGGCAKATLCPALSLPSLLGTSTTGLTQPSIDALLTAVPDYFKRAVITPAGDYATLSFGIRLMPLSEQRKLIAYMRAHLDPPHGVTAALAGLPVLAADADGSLSSSSHRLRTVLLGLLLVAAALLLAFRDFKRALVPLVPIVFATGWSALIVYLLGIPLNPLSATLGVLVIAISTEFSVLLCERVRGGSGTLLQALQRAYRTTGVAIVTSAVTVIVGFGVLILSDIKMLSDFGLVTLVDLTVSLVGVLITLPAVLALTAGRQPQERHAARPAVLQTAPEGEAGESTP